ncbi:hypothetical protein WICMUC_005382 [Wickerhamomyces mucosus]|uniref:Uncharacterized protein n=1 Tax=Wickerhamomyces mucosus TaxID=1378264 RepID=A0A9P8P895_9ASCO|nr:hypothetical protein WICMUC_005382 [Wickerhamomyces mucosus]
MVQFSILIIPFNSEFLTRLTKVAFSNSLNSSFCTNFNNFGSSIGFANNDRTNLVLSFIICFGDFPSDLNAGWFNDSNILSFSDEISVSELEEYEEWYISDN